MNMLKSDGRFLLFFLVNMSCVTAHAQLTKEGLLQESQTQPTGLKNEKILQYLSQNDTDPSVCDPKLGVLKKERGSFIRDLGESYDARRVSHKTFKACVTSLSDNLSESDRKVLQVTLEKLLKESLSKDLTQDGAIDEFSNLTETIFANPWRFDLGPAVSLAEKHPTGDHRAREVLRSFIESAAISSGKNRAVDQITDRQLLQKIERLHPDEPTKKRARRRHVRLLVDGSQNSIITRDREAAQERIFRAGYYALENRDIDRMVIKKDPQSHPIDIRLAGEESGIYNVQSMEAIDLKDFVGFTLKAHDGPAELCRASSEISAVPCVPVNLLTTHSELGSIDERGFFAIKPTYTFDSLKTGLGRIHDGDADIKFRDQNVRLPLRVSFLKPKDLQFKSPHVQGTVEVLANRAFFTFEQKRAIVEWDDLPSFKVLSSGKDGAPGQDGSEGQQGLSGQSGMDGHCFGASADGGDGTGGMPGMNGSDGGRGQDGEKGGDITVTILCKADDCAKLRNLTRPLFVASGGKGGPGGKGGKAGKGGQGGTGGRGASCDETASSTRQVSTPGYGSAGRNGSDGIDGMDGQDGKSGQDGPPGRVQVIYREL